ncbi:MAG: DUF2914 domain-containing protein [Deltaproteobacteria bacterium]|nr:DUF2914 domain-containing protein [Deltaproteobacteria bacterium]
MSRIRKIFFFVILSYSIIFPVFAQDLYIDELVIARHIEDHVPVEIGCVFPADVKRLYCFTKICGVRSKTAITHNWYWNNREIATIRLSIGTPTWRTFSSIEIPSYWRGHWWVDIKHGDNYIGGTDFIIK